ncbi:MAG: chorismate mutase [Candidatus Aminicenantes bacterium]|nr:chorismate mutase [Candidatus Aminicenantes bacterium]
MTDIDRWRSNIDRIDLELVELLNRRSKCAIEIGKIKHKLKLSVYDPEREEEVIRLVQEATGGPLSKSAIKRLFERIIDESRRAEREYRNGS